MATLRIDGGFVKDLQQELIGVTLLAKAISWVGSRVNRKHAQSESSYVM